METGIIFERSAARPFAVSLANKLPGLPEEIRREDIEALRDEWNQLYENYLAAGKAIRREIEIRLAQAQADGFDTKGW